MFAASETLQYKIYSLKIILQIILKTWKHNLKNRIADIKSILNHLERKRFILLIFFNTLLSLADIASIALVFIVLNIYSGKPASSLLPYMEQFHINQQSLIPAISLIILFVAKNIAGYFIIKAQSRYVADLATRLASRNLLLYFEGSYEDYVNIDSSVWMRRICFQAQEFSQYVLGSVQQIINEIILITITITALALYNVKVLMIVSLILLPAVFLLSYITRKRLKDTRENIKTSNEITLQHLNESIAGFVESNIYNKNDFFTNRYKKSQSVLNRFIADMQVTQMMPARFFETFAVLGLFIFIALMQLNKKDDNDGIFMLGAFIAAAYKIIPGISRIINYASQIKTYSFTISEIKKAVAQRVSKQSSAIKNIEKIELQNVHFTYKENTVLNDFSCIIHKGNFIGINGASGRGKTTLIDILLGFLSPQNGSILFNDEVIFSPEIKKFWSQISYVKQTTFLLYDSILHNITLYEDYDKKKLANIIEVAGLKPWLDELKDGVHTTITEGGKNISGGQRQRIAIARALFKEAPLIVLDEPFNELDEVSEISLLNYFKQLSVTGTTILLITHNLTSFDYCDNMIYLDEVK
jgi:ABC-type bacteriocin/lantibiotic exporter with double-glycine peptidase domain